MRRTAHGRQCRTNAMGTRTLGPEKPQVTVCRCCCVQRSMVSFSQKQKMPHLVSLISSAAGWTLAPCTRWHRELAAVSALKKTPESASLYRLQMTEAALALSEQKVHNLGELLNAMKQEQNCVAECHFRELQQQKQVSWISPSCV